MIIRERPSALKLFLLLRGSIVPRILPSLLLCMLVATLVTVSDGDLFHLKIKLTPIPFSLIGLALAIFLGFRNNAAYDRYWEARKMWGEIVYRSRNLARQCLCYLNSGDAVLDAYDLQDVRARIVHRAIAFAYALKHGLRDTDPKTAADEIRPHLRLPEWRRLESIKNRPDYLLRHIGHDVQLCLKNDEIDSCLAAQIESGICSMAGAAAACERIKSTPIPFSYTLLLHRTAYLYCFLLPFGLVDSIGFMTPFVVGIVAYTFFGLDALGDEIEEPFGIDANDLPLDAICRNIEIDLRAALGDENVPKPLEPINFCLS